MHIEAKPGDFWVTITGSATELMEARRKLEGWSKDLDPTGSGRAMCLERAGALRVPAGAVLQLQECQPVIGVPERATVAEHASKLRVAGLLRDYQARAVTAALCAPLGRGTLDMACGAGKTRVSAALAAVAQAATGRGSWLYLVKNNELARQSEREFVEVLQKMADVLQSCLSHDRSPEPASIAATTYSGIDKLVKKEFDGVIVDECLPAGMMIGDKPIESIRVGDSVPSWDFRTGRLTYRRVLRTFCEPSRASYLVEIQVGSTRLLATPTHPIPCDMHWRPIRDVRCGDSVLGWATPQEEEHGRETNRRQPMRSMQQRNHKRAQTDRSRVTLQRMQFNSAKRARESSSRTVQGMRRASDVDRKTWVATGPGGRGVLLQRAQIALDQTALVGKWETRGAKTRVGNFRKNAQGKPDVAARCTRTGSSQDAVAWLARGSDSRGQRTSTSCTTEIVGLRVGLADGSRSVYGQTSTSRIAQCVQGGYWPSRFESWHRGGWIGAQRPSSKSARCEKRNGIVWLRVDRITIHEQTSDGTFGGLCPNGLVYNLEIEGAGYNEKNYIANGLVVHNCHELTPITRCVPFATVKALWRVGMSGTLLDRQDANNALTLALLGPPLCKISIAELEREGHLSQGRVQILKFDHRTNRLV